jgi:cell pole-organizing protein PopZ
MAVHENPLGTGLEYPTEDRAAEEPVLRPSIRDEMPEAEDTPVVAASALESRGEVSSPLALDRQDRNCAPLVSPSTDASVASSFQSLAASMFLRDSDLIARTAREMLRPMLKQWLDDNLPVMVERLVRAEIERVARGGR